MIIHMWTPSGKSFSNIQSSLVNSKSLGQEDLFRSIKNLNYREVEDIKIYNPLGCVSPLNISFGSV